MRVLHTADWHLGRTLEGRSRLAEQRAVLSEICAIAEDEAVDLVLIAGDVYDSVNPPAAAEELFYDTLERLTGDGRRAVVAIAGNHDNPERLRAPQPLARRHGIALAGLPGETVPCGPCITASGPGWVRVAPPRCTAEAVIALLPYPSEARLGRALGETLDEAVLQGAYSAQVGALLELAARAFGPGTVNLVAGHIYAAGGIESASERPIQVGGAYTVAASAFPAGAGYVALGHLHRPQVIAAPLHVRYSGRPLALGFAEAGQAKGVVLLDAEAGAPVTWREIHCTAGRPLVTWRATEGLDQVLGWVGAGRDPRAFIDLELHVPQSLSAGELQTLRQLPVDLVHIRPVVAAAAAGPSPEARRGLPVQELFRLFYRQSTGGDPPQAVAALFAELIAEQDAREETA